MNTEKRDVGIELLQAIQDIKKGKGITIENNNDIISIRKQLHLSQKAMGTRQT